MKTENLPRAAAIHTEVVRLQKYLSDLNKIKVETLKPISVYIAVNWIGGGQATIVVRDEVLGLLFDDMSQEVNRSIDDLLAEAEAL